MICYVATHNDSGRKYIGITNDKLSLRKSTHESHARKGVDNTFFHLAIREFGADSFSWAVVAQGNKKVIGILENALIHTWRTNDPAHGFNTRGGNTWIDFPPLSQPPQDCADMYEEFGDVRVLHMMNDLGSIISWIERNDPGGDRCRDLWELCRRLQNRLNLIDPDGNHVQEAAR